MEYYRIAKCSGNPDWEKIETVSLENIQWLPDIGIRTYFQLAYDEEAIYVHMRSVEKDIRAEHKTQNCRICQDSCMEFFFRPEGDSRYMNFEVNLNGQFYIGIGHGREDSVRILASEQQEKDFMQSEGRKTEDGWEIFYRIPVTFLSLFYPEIALKSGKKLYANLYKCGDLTPVKHYITWNKIDIAKPDYHRPEYFGEMVLE